MRPGVGGNLDLKRSMVPNHLWLQHQLRILFSLQERHAQMPRCDLEDNEKERISERAKPELEENNREGNSFQGVKSVPNQGTRDPSKYLLWSFKNVLTSVSAGCL